MRTEDLNTCIDLSLLEDYLARLSKSTVKQMLTLYVQQVELYLKDIKQAQADDSFTDWQDNCHKMKGAAASVGMLELHARLKEVEKSKASPEEKADFILQLEKLNQQGIQAFKTWLSEV